MIKIQIGVVICLSLLLAASASAQTADIRGFSQGVDSYNNHNQVYRSKTYIACQAKVFFSNAYSGGPSDPDNAFQINIDLFNQSSVQFAGGGCAFVELPWNTSQEITGGQTVYVSLLNGVGITSVTGDITAQWNNYIPATVMEVQNSAFTWNY